MIPTRVSRPRVSAELMTAEQFLQSEQPPRCELIRGQVVELMPPGAEHGLVVASIATILGPFLHLHRLGKLLAGDPGFVLTRGPDTVRAPDLAFLAAERIGATGVPIGFADIPPDLAIEVVSPNDRWTELEAKSRQWFAFGVRELWIADPQLGEIRVLRDGEAPQVFGSGDELRSALLPGFTAPVQALLGRI